jgi:uracil-DNA glycosylase
MTVKNIQQKLYEKLKASGWGDKLKMFVLSQEFHNILVKLYEDSKEGKRFTPTLKDIFKAFEECPYNELKIVIINNEPYPGAGIADGIPFSCSYSEKIEPPLKYILKEIENTVYPNGKERNTDLKRWSNQGILMLNTALTCEVGKTDESHADLWKPFTTNLLDMLTTYNSGLLYVFIGRKVESWHKLITPSNYKFFTTDPYVAKYRNNIWNSGNLFNQINDVLQKNNGEKIIW